MKQVTENTMLCITTTSRSYANEPVKIKRSLRPARTQLSTISYETEEISESPINNSDPTKFSKPIERETPGRDQVKPTAYTQRNWNPKPKIDNQDRRGQNSSPRSDLNEIEPN